ncbi:MAG: glycosyl transferase [Flavobacteriaceae bacterium]|nr:glycosyl transferase [Flavobacteriaceae bacterium]
MNITKTKALLPDFKNNLISIVMPCWKAEKFISESINSVINQTYGNWELLIVDDCSPDNTAKIVENYCKLDSRIKIFRQSQNGGPARARNRALDAAKGRWVAFLDCDDIWDKAKLERQLSFHKDVRTVLTFTSFRRFGNSKRVGREIPVPKFLDYSALLGNTAIATSTVLIDRSLSGHFCMKPIYYDDFGCWLDLLRYGQRAAGLNECLMEYRVITGSVSRNKLTSAIEVWKTMRITERLSLIASIRHFSMYALRGIFKYSRF